ncbi:hypothetical protein FACS189459_6700 [Bacilli bacterium]|nr:hypothetical protein FACS189459_6700 [Bacilli bacterium]
MVGEAFVNIFMQAFDFKIHFGFVLLIAVLILVAFIALNIFKPNAGSAFSKYTTLIKFIPILVIILMGCIYASIKGLGISYFSSSNEKVGNFMPLAMFSCLPAVLFSFDGFSVVGSLKSKIINPEKTLPRAMFYSMIVVSLTYILISLSEILVGADSAFELVDKILPQKMIIGVNIFLNVLVWLCVLSGCNGLTIATLNTTQAAIEERKIVGSD